EQESSLVHNAVEVFASCDQRLAVVVHHHGHRQNVMLLEETEQLDRFLGRLTLVDQFRRQILNAEPDGVQACPVSQRQKVLALEHIELGCFGGKSDSPT